MPNKPTTLREEFIKKSTTDDNVELGRVTKERIADWWLDKFSSHNTELISKIEGMKLSEKGILNIQYEVDKKYSMQIDSDRALIYNQALDQVINLINQEK